MLHPTISPDFEAALQRIIDETADQPRRIATFDGDNTLWDGDIGEAFLRWLIAAGHIMAPAGVDDVWEEYEAKVAQDRVVGYAWAIQVMAGLPEAQLVTWARHFCYSWANWRDGMSGVISYLEAAGVEVWIVSASGALVVREAAPYLGIPKERVLGMEVELTDGVLTDVMKKPLTACAGKVDAIQQTMGLRPIAAFGDSLGDLEMLEYAQQAFVVGQRSRTNQGFIDLARERGWPTNEF